MKECRSSLCRTSRSRANAAAVEQSAPAPAAAELPVALRNATAVLKANDATVYVLGVSHVSAVACDQIKELVAAVKPEVVVVEVCKDRTPLLVDPETMTKAPDTWTCTRIDFDGLPSAKKDGDNDEEKDKDDKDKEKTPEQKAAAAAEKALAREVWPTAEDLAPLLRTRIGRIITTSEVEGDVATLEATGLFSRVRPACDAGRPGDAPLFCAVKAEGEAGGLELEYVAPLGCTRFVVQPRSLPAIKSLGVRLDSSLKASGVTQEQLDEVAAEALAAATADPPRTPLLVYLAARKRLIDLVRGSQQQQQGQQQEGAEALQQQQQQQDGGSGSSGADDVIVDFTGIDSGKAEAVVRARRLGDGDAPFVSGLESSAEEGADIERFRPMRRGVQLSPRMSLPAEAAARMNAIKAARRAEAAMTARGAAAGGVRPYYFRWWRPEEVAPADLTTPEPDPSKDLLAMVLTRAYSGLQAKAGRAAGVESGAAWRAAMRAATEHGASQVILGDRPAMISQRRLADAMFPETAARLGGALALLAAAAVAGNVGPLPDLLDGALPGAGAGAGAAALAVGLAAAAAVLWPVVGPLVEVWQFSKLDGPAVEDAVAVKEPIQANLDKPLLFWGEDALLRWPGVWTPLIAERDAYMARVAAAAATGAPTGAPAYVADEANGQLVWRYAMARDAPEGSAPKGLGEGEYLPPAGAKNVVVVVGTAHVRGMCREWETALARPGDVGKLAPAAEQRPDKE